GVADGQLGGVADLTAVVQEQGPGGADPHDEAAGGQHALAGRDPPDRLPLLTGDDLEHNLLHSRSPVGGGRVPPDGSETKGGRRAFKACWGRPGYAGGGVG